MKEIWAYVEMAAGKVLRPSREALSEAVRQGRQLRARTTALVLGHGIPEEVIEAVGRCGPDRILVLDDEHLSEYGTEPYAACIETLLQEHKPDAFLLGSSVASRDLAPRLSARLKSSLVTEATFLNPQGGRWMVTRSAYRPHASMILAPMDTGLQIVTLASKVMDAEETGRSDGLSVQAVTGGRNLPRCHVRIWDNRMEGSDSYATARVLAAALRRERFDLVFCGWRRADLEQGQVGPSLAEILDLPQATGARKIELVENNTRILLHKRVPGYLTKLSCPLPALVTMEKGQVLRYPSLAGRQRAARAEIPCLGLDTVGLREENVGASGSTTRLERFTPPKPTRRSAMASTAGKMTAAARLQRIMGGGVQEKKDSKIWDCPDESSVKKVVEHIVKEKMITFRSPPNDSDAPLPFHCTAYAP